MVMMRAILATAIAGVLAPPAAAAPCTVELVTVPDDARPVIEQWVADEPRCGPKLSVRVIPTTGGFYVLASDGSGRIRERIVPDALTAAVLIASWVADDGTASPPAPAPPAPIDPTAPAPTPVTAAITPTWAMKTPPVTPTWVMKTPPVTPTWAMKTPPVTPTWAMKTPPVTPDWAVPVAAPPGETAPVVVDAPVDVAPAAATAAAGFERYAGLGVVVHDDGAGLRGEVDLLRRWRFELGVAVEWSQTDFFYDYKVDDVMLMAQGTRQLRMGRFAVRGSVAVGMAITRVETDAMSQSMLSPAADAQLSVGIRVYRKVEARFGAGLLFLPQRIWRDGYQERGLDPQVFVGVGYRGF